MLSIDTYLNPFRIKLRGRKPVQLKVVIKNTGQDKVLLSYDVIVSRALSLDNGGYKTSLSEKAGEIEAGKSITAYFDIHPKPLTREGEYPVMVKASEHYNGYGFVKQEYTKKLEIRADE